MADIASLPPERIRVRCAMAITGLERRTLQNLSAQGKIPGAAKLGGVWTYDETRLRRWVKQREDACRTISISAEEPGTPGFRSKGATIDDLYEQALR